MNLQQAVYALVHDSKHPPKKIAAESDISYGYLLKAADEMQPDVQLQARVVPPVTLASENDVVIKCLAVECGGVFVRVARSGAKPADILSGIAGLSREFSDSIEALTACLDGTSPVEKADGIQQLTELIEKAAAAREQLQASVGK